MIKRTTGNPSSTLLSYAPTTTDANSTASASVVVMGNSRGITRGDGGARKANGGVTVARSTLLGNNAMLVPTTPLARLQRQQQQPTLVTGDLDSQVTATGIPVSLLWLPYAGIVAVLLLLLCVSFCSYHRKHGRKYFRRRTGSGSGGNGGGRVDGRARADAATTSYLDNDVIDDYFERAASAYGGGGGGMNTSSTLTSLALSAHGHDPNQSHHQHQSSRRRASMSFDPTTTTVTSYSSPFARSRLATSASATEDGLLLQQYVHATPHVSNSPDLDLDRHGRRRGRGQQPDRHTAGNDAMRQQEVYDVLADAFSSGVGNGSAGVAQRMNGGMGESKSRGGGGGGGGGGSGINVCMLDMEGVFSSGFAPWDRSCEDLTGVLEVLPLSSRVGSVNLPYHVMTSTSPATSARPSLHNGVGDSRWVNTGQKGSRTASTSLLSNGPSRTIDESKTALGLHNNKVATSSHSHAGGKSSKGEGRRKLPSTDAVKQSDVSKNKPKLPQGHSQGKGNSDLRQLHIHTLVSPSQRRYHSYDDGDENKKCIVAISQPMRNTRL